MAGSLPRLRACKFRDHILFTSVSLLPGISAGIEWCSITVGGINESMKVWLLSPWHCEGYKKNGSHVLCSSRSSQSRCGSEENKHSRQYITKEVHVICITGVLRGQSGQARETRWGAQPSSGT